MTTQPVSVLMFSNGVVRGGAEEHILQLLNGLDRKRFHPSLACTPELARLLHRDLPQDIRVCQLHLDGLTDWRGAVKLSAFLREKKIHILHSHMFRASFFASPLGRISRVPVIVETAHVREVWRKGWKSNFLLDRAVSTCVDQTIAVSNAIASYLIESKGIPRNKITVIPTAPAISEPAARHPSQAQRKCALGVCETAPLIVLAGRLEPQKGHSVAIHAMQAILDEFPRAQMVFLGEGGLRTKLERLVKDKQLGSSVRFAGYQTNVRDWFAAADLTILPSFYEGLPMTILEALQEACPVVATAVDGTPEVIRNGKTGMLVRPGDSAHLAQAVCAMLRDPAFARHTALAGRRDVMENFSVEKLIVRTQQFYSRTWDRYLRRTNPHPAVPTRVKSDSYLAS